MRSKLYLGNLKDRDRFKDRLQNNINMGLSVIRSEGSDWINLAQWCALVNTVIKLPVSQ
jgi:hypothetical protein